jgi:molecular chaperone GrpE
MSKEVSNEELNEKELETPVTEGIQEGQAEDANTEEETAEEPEEELPPPTPEELKQLRTDAAKAGEYYERLLRQVAETDNLRKRLAKEKQDAIRYANESLIEQLLPTMDSFDMAMLAVKNAEETTIDSLKIGIEMVHTQLKRTLEEVGLSEIDAAGQSFDPALHEAMSRKETDETDEGTVLEQIRKGYKLKDRLVRPASVVVATAPGAEPEPEEGEEA